LLTAKRYDKYPCLFIWEFLGSDSIHVHPGKELSRIVKNLWVSSLDFSRSSMTILAKIFEDQKGFKFATLARILSENVKHP